MSLYYLMLLMTRFHSDPRVGTPLFDAGVVLVTPVKIVGMFTVLAALIAARPADAAPRLRNPLVIFWTTFAILEVIGDFVFRLPTPWSYISSLISFSLLLLATRLLVTTEERMRKAVRVIILASAFASLWIYRQHFVQHYVRAQGLEQDSNYEALTLVTGIPLALWMTRNEMGSWWRRTGAVCAGLMSGGVVLTESRAGLIAAAIMSLAAVLLSGRKIATLALLAVAAALGIAVAPHGLAERFHSIKLHGAANNGDEASARIHYELFKAGLVMIRTQPLAGVGLEQFKTVAPDYNPELLRVAGRSYIAHDTYIQIAAECGLPALAAFLAMMVLAIVNCRTVRRSANPALADLALAIQLALVGFSVAAVSVTAECVTTYWTLIFLSQNLVEISEATSKQHICHSQARSTASTPPVRVSARGVSNGLNPIPLSRGA